MHQPESHPPPALRRRIMARLFIAFQNVVPQQLLTRAAGAVAELRRPAWLKNLFIRRFISAYGVNMAESAEPDYRNFPCFNDFFTRALRPGARPLAAADILCPADGAISQLGDITNGALIQAKGREFTTTDLLGGDAERAAQFQDGQFATIYLSPKDYHRVHMPVAGTLQHTQFVPGKLFSVNGVTAENVDRLFARNERLICYFDTEHGPMAMILVGAMIVAGIQTVWAGRMAPQRAATVDFSKTLPAVTLAKGDEMGRFLLGSTVILLFPKGVMQWDPQYRAGTATRMGEPLGTWQALRP